MKQIIHLDNELKHDIENLESACDQLCRSIFLDFQPPFEERGQHLILEVIRTQKGHKKESTDCFADAYESFIEIGLEQEDEYFPNGYIPIWKCKEEWFEKTGYLTSKTIRELEKMLKAMVVEMLEE